MPLIPKNEPPYYERSNTMPTPGTEKPTLIGLISQVADGDPIITVLHNTLSPITSLTRTAKGQYLLTLNNNVLPIDRITTGFGNFGGNNTRFAVLTGDGTTKGYYTIYYNDVNKISIQSRDAALALEDLSVILDADNASIEIQITAFPA